MPLDDSPPRGERIAITSDTDAGPSVDASRSDVVRPESTAGAVKELLVAGHRRVDVARILGVSTSTVSRHAQRLGFPDQRRKPARLDWLTIRTLYEAGASMRECQFEFGFSNGAWDGAVARGDIVPRLDPRRRVASETRLRVHEGLAEGGSLSAIARRLDISKSTVAYHARRLGRTPDARFQRRYDWAAIQTYYDDGHSRPECAEHFGFNLGSWHKAVQRGDITPRSHVMAVDVLLAAGQPRSRGHLKLRLMGAGLKENRCEECGISEWRGRPLSLALHHVNGIRDDNRLENLLFLCPNCHSQTENFSGRNVRRRAA